MQPNHAWNADHRLEVVGIPGRPDLSFPSFAEGQLAPAPAYALESSWSPAEGLTPGAAPLKIKRAFDVLLSAAALILLSPLLLALGALVRWTSPGPVFHRCSVVGGRGRPFTLYKFRTMVQGAEGKKHQLLNDNEAHWPMFKMRRDPRITRLGRCLRKYSLDELPQLWNILRGDMSFVGPRPALVSEWVHFTPRQRLKLHTVAGAVSLWHMEGQPRRLDEWVRLDMEYQKNWSLWLDLKTLLGGLWFMISGQNF